MNVYDEVYYPTHSFPQTHPDRLSTLATLFGMTPAPIVNCRYLELGCGDAGNLIPMAFNLPNSEFVGVDLAGAPIAMGREYASELGLTNLTLHQMGIEEIDREFGEFDYIVAHGVYSWVPASVRENLLAICGRNLAPQGVAYISYNTFPGAHLRKMMREMMLFHIKEFEDPDSKIVQAQALLGFLSASREKDDVYIEFLKQELARTQKFHRSHLFHDDLSEINHPVYFHEFLGEAAKSGLRFLAEADYFEMRPTLFSQHAVKALDALGDDIVRREQYSDFIKCRRFRQTLLCRHDVMPDRTGEIEHVYNMYFNSPLKPSDPSHDLNSKELQEFLTDRKSRISTDHPLLKHAFFLLGQRYPQVYHFDELFESAALRMGKSAEELSSDGQRTVLAEALIEAYGSDVVQFHSFRPRFVTDVSERPNISDLVKMQLNHGNSITNELHMTIGMEDELGRALLRLLDGTRSRNDIKSALRQRVLAGEIPIEGSETGEVTEEKLQTLIDEQLERSLTWLSKHGIFAS